MKKLLALTLAMAMVLSMASVAFAAGEKYELDVFEYLASDKVYDVDEDGDYVDSEKLTGNFGNSFYLPFYVDEEPLQDSEIADKIKVKSEFTTGAEYVASVGLAKIKSNDGNAYYAIKIKTKDAPTITKSKDVIGEITVSGSKFSPKEQKVQVAFSLSNKDASNVKGQDKRDETMDGWYVYNFDGIEDDEYEFELYADMGRFVVDTNGQGKLVIKTNVKYNSGIEMADPDVNYVYFNGNNAAFNKIGDLYLKAEEGSFIYKRNADDTLTKLDVPYDKDEEAFVVRTRVIGSYVISEEELNVEEINAAVLASKEETAAPEAMTPANPSTGAAC